MGVRYNFPPNFFYKLKVAEIVNIFVGEKKNFHEVFDFDISVYPEDFPPSSNSLWASVVLSDGCFGDVDKDIFAHFKKPLSANV